MTEIHHTHRTIAMARLPRDAEIRGRMIVEQLGGVWRGTRGECRCPVHDDSSPSLSVRLGDTAILFHCFAGCTTVDVMKALQRRKLHDREPLAMPEAKPKRDMGALARRLWNASVPIAGTLAEDYLLARGLSGPFSKALRFNPSTILGSGSTTRGQRQTGGQGLFDPRDDLESDYAKESLEQWFRLLADGKLRSTTLDQFQKLTGLELEGEGGGLKEDLPPIQRWLNRILALRIALQNAIFDEYLGLIEARIEAAREAGTLDLGVESINAERITILDRTVIRRDQTSGAETEILRLEAEERYKPLALDRALRILGEDSRPMVNRKSGKAAIRSSTYSLTDDDGEIVRRYELVRPTRSERMRQDLFVETMWEEASEEEFSALWQAEVDEMSGKIRTSTLYLVTGLLLPVWDRLPDDHVQVWRLNTDDGESFLGRIVPAPLVSKLADAFGIAATITVSGAETARHVMGSGEIATVGAYRLKRSLVAGQQRLELLDWPHTRMPELKAAGCFTEIIQHKTRMFVPVATAAAVIDRITA